MGVNKANYIYIRAGVTRRNPVGRNWVRIGGRLNYVSVGCTGIYGVSKNTRIWRYYGEFFPAIFIKDLQFLHKTISVFKKAVI